MTSTISSDHINTTRKRLEEALGPEKKVKYFYYMKQWFRMRVSGSNGAVNENGTRQLDGHLFLLLGITNCMMD